MSPTLCDMDVRVEAYAIKSTMCMLATWHPIWGRAITLSNFHALEKQQGCWVNLCINLDIFLHRDDAFISQAVYNFIGFSFHMGGNESEGGSQEGTEHFKQVEESPSRGYFR